MQQTNHTETKQTSVADLIGMSLKERETFINRLLNAKLASWKRN